MPESDGADTGRRGGWTLITNHGACLIYLAEYPNATVREIAAAVGITERAAARILHNLREEGYLTARRVGRGNVYQLDPDLPLRHPVGEAKRVADLLSGLVDIDRWFHGARPLLAPPGEEAPPQGAPSGQSPPAAPDASSAPG